MNILIIEDDPFLACHMNKCFQSQKFSHRSKICLTYEDFLYQLSHISAFDIVLTDIDLGNGCDIKSGFQVIEKIRSRNINIPIIVVSCFGEIDSMEKAFSIGANDYIIKPFRLKELEIRVNNRFKTQYISMFFTLSYENLIYEGLIYNIDEHEFYFCNIQIKLSKQNKYLLSLLFLNREKLLRESYLIEKIWGDYGVFHQRNVRTVIMRLKDILKPLGIDNWVRNIPGEGYILKK